MLDSTTIAAIFSDVKRRCVKMKRLVCVTLAVLLLLCGCSQEERVPCVHCGEQIARGITLGNGDTVCGVCFSDCGYLICLGCGDAYDPYNSAAASIGYCGRCESKYAGACERCDEYYPLEQLVIADEGYFLCVKCWNADLISIISDPATFKYTEEDRKNAYDEGYDSGYNLGYETGTKDGYEAGTAAGHDNGYSEGYQTGLEEGQKQGYSSGYTDGAKSAASSTRSSSSTQTSGGSASSKSASSGSSTSSQTQSVTVYITKTGSKYHRSGCQYLSKSKISISLNDAKARGYTACSRCW